MAWTVDKPRSKKIRLADNTLVARRVVLVSAETGEEKVLEWNRGEMAAAKFNDMIVGVGGSLDAPGGEVAAWLAHLNTPALVEDPF